MKTNAALLTLTLTASLTAAVAAAARADEPVMHPAIDGPWWQVAGNPDLGRWTSEEQQPVDFGVWQARDGTWQLWSCIRKTKVGGNTRLFYRWEGRHLTDRDWKPVGVAMTADPELGESPGGLQAPHVIVIDGVYHMFYGDWSNICLATSRDGKQFERVLGDDGRPQLFGDDTPDEWVNARDPMVLPAGDTFYCYYTAFPGREGAVYCRTSNDLEQWSEPVKVAFGGQAGTKYYSAECPHLVSRHGWYYLMRTQRYGQNAQTSVYRSKDPLDFGVDDDRHFIGRLPVAAPEIVHHEGQDYIAALLPSLTGIQIARLKWEADPAE